MSWREVVGLTLLFLFVGLKIFFDLNPGKWGWVSIGVGVLLMLPDQAEAAQ